MAEPCGNLTDAHLFSPISSNPSHGFGALAVPTVNQSKREANSNVVEMALKRAPLRREIAAMTAS